ncbi:DNA-binding GntR family transcriptional regulator [Marmoricola sp. URHA0025 HA25]
MRLTHGWSLRDQALALLRQRLTAGEVKPDDILSVSALASELGVSTSPVREAMLALVDEGIMESVRNRGYRVVPLTLADRREIHQLRMMLEPLATRLLAEDPTPILPQRDELAAIADVTVESAAEGDLVAHLEADRRFHLGLVGAVGNGRLTDMVMRLRDQTQRSALRSLSREFLRTTSLEHAQILDAVVAGDEALAEALMVRHVKRLDPDLPPEGS